MALNFTYNSGIYVSHGTPAGLNNMNPLTIMAWVRFVNGTQGTYFSIVNKPHSGEDGQVLFFNGSAGVPTDIVGFTTTTGQWVHGRAALSNWSFYASGKWVFVVYARNNLDSGGPYLFMGDEYNKASEPGTYITRLDGEVTQHNDAPQDLEIGRGRDANDRCWLGDIAAVHVVEGTLTLAEILHQQFNGFTPMANGTTRLLSHYGFEGGGSGATVPDWSGNGHNGTITGGSLTVVDHPLIALPFSRRSRRKFFLSSAVVPVPNLIVNQAAARW